MEERCRPDELFAGDRFEWRPTRGKRTFGLARRPFATGTVIRIIEHEHVTDVVYDDEGRQEVAHVPATDLVAVERAQSDDVDGFESDPAAWLEGLMVPGELKPTEDVSVGDVVRVFKVIEQTRRGRWGLVVKGERELRLEGEVLTVERIKSGISVRVRDDYLGRGVVKFTLRPGDTSVEVRGPDVPYPAQ